jgi:transglutaminase-like putative cysteine protease
VERNGPPHQLISALPRKKYPSGIISMQVIDKRTEMGTACYSTKKIFDDKKQYILRMNPKTTNRGIRFILLIVGILSLFMLHQACSSGDHFIQDRKYRKQVQKDFKARQQLAHNRAFALFGVMESRDLLRKEQEALQFLYAYMPLADLAEYDGAFYLRNIRHSFMVQDSLPWGKTIPEDIFRHYVLPVRVNNESLDSARWVFYDELEPRVKNLTLEQAALEVNRWCHEKVTYKGTDGRTSSPLNTVKNAFGRCGEESVLTVAALRSVGIPARQVYVPRWAHSDDNHAWVEVWVDGQWHYMGACEPEPALNRGWFTGPSKRAMLVHTRVFGNYQGNEEVITRESDYAIINSTAIYTEVAKPLIIVVDEHGNPVQNASVEFGLYNYAEFYPIATLTTNHKGECSLTIGKGDILLHATDGTRCTWSKQDLRTDTLVRLTLKPCRLLAEAESWHFDIPDEVPVGEESLSDEVMAAHKKLLAQEDSIRNAYVKTFPAKEDMIAFAREINAPEDSVAKYLSISQGNHSEIAHFLRNTNIFRHLQFLTEKDIRDTRHDVLYAVAREAPPLITHFVDRSGDRTENIAIDSTMAGHVNFARSLKSIGGEMYLQYIWNPKIDLEVLKPYRYLLNTHFTNLFGQEATPQMLFDWIRDSIVVDTTPYYSRILITPSGVHHLRVADPYSRNIYFVAVCRSMGIPARLEPATRVPQAMVNNEWRDFDFNKPVDRSVADRGNLAIGSPGDKTDPHYYNRFTIARLENGTFKTLEFPWGQPLSRFELPLRLNPGSYALTSGLRQQNGDIDVVRTYFTVEAGKSTEILFPVPKPEKRVYGEWPAIASVSMESGFIFLLLDATGEPSRHLLQELQNGYAADGPAMPRVVIMWDKGEDAKGSELLSRYKLTDKTVSMTFDEKVKSGLVQMMTSETRTIPLAVCVNAQREILFLAGGYQINSITQMKELLAAEKP